MTKRGKMLLAFDNGQSSKLYWKARKAEPSISSF